MRYRSFGKTGLALSIFTLNSRGFAVSPDDRNRDRKLEQCAQAFLRGLELGINSVDVGPELGEAEALVGEALASSGKTDVHVNVRVPLCDCADGMKARIERSLRLLRRDTIDVLTMDPVNTASCLNKVTSPTGCMKAVEEAQAQGLVKHLGISTHGPMEFVLKALDTELFEGVQIHYSYFNQRNQAVLDKATEMKIGVAVVSPVDRGGSLSHPSAILEECCEPLHPIVVNHRFILQHAAVTTVCIDAARARDFDVHEPVFENDGPLSDLETLSLARLDVRRLQLPGTWCTFCHDCLPCPEGIHIPEILRLRNMALAYDMTEHARSQYRNLDGNGWVWVRGQTGDQCTECGDCLPRCPERLEIPKLLEETHEMFRANHKRKTVKANQTQS